MEQNGSVKDSVPNLALKNQTDISTGIGPTGTDTPAPKDLMPHADEQSQMHSLKEPLSRPAGALFEVGSGQKCNTGDHSC